MACQDVRAALAALPQCMETNEGARVTTHCLYPSFEPVSVYVVRYGEGFKVHDGGGAARSAWDHGRDMALVRRHLSRQASLYHLSLVDNSLVAEVLHPEWLTSAILSVANASSATAQAVAEHVVAASEATLKDEMYAVLLQTVPEKAIAKDYELSGKSGKRHTFDFAVRSHPNDWLIMDAVAPHHSSIYAKYVAFADTKELQDAALGRFAVFKRPLGADDISLLSQVADLVPFGALQEGVLREIAFAASRNPHPSH